MIERITLLGSSSGRNAGDAALLSGIMDSIDGIFGTRLLYEIPTFRPEYIWNNYQNRVRPISMLPWSGAVGMAGLPTLASLHRTDLALIFDAILFDRWLYNPLKNYLSTLALVLPALKKRGKKFGCFDVGIGPIQTARGKELLTRLIDSLDFITVRDTDSFDILTSLGIRHPRTLITADAALNTPPCTDERTDSILATLKLSRGQDIIAINFSRYLDSWIGSRDKEPMRREHFVETMTKALERVQEETKAALLFVCTQHADVPLTESVMNGVRSTGAKALVSNLRLNHHDIRGVLSAVSLLFGMRLHATILAAAGLTPITALPHQPKVCHFFKTLGLENFVMDFSLFSEDGLTKQILDAWHNRSLIKSALKDRIPGQRKRALIPALLTKVISDGGDLDQAVEKMREPV